jgi:multiple sugar transport system substrate-binding protein
MADLTPYMNGGLLKLDTVDENYLSGGRIDGKLYGVSLGTNSVCLIYDPAMLKKAGVAEPLPTWTWADFEKMAQQIYANTKVQTLPNFYSDPRVGFENWIRQTGNLLFSADGKSLGFKDPAPLEEFWAIQLRLLQTGALVKPEIAFVAGSINEDQFSKGNSWVQYVWSNQVVSAQAAANKPVKIALMPKIAGAKQPGTFLKPSMFFSISQSTKIGIESAKFINYFVTGTDANKVLLGERGVPIVPAVRDTVKEAVDPYSSMVFDFIGLVGKGNASKLPAPDPAASGEVLKLFRDTTMEVLYGKVTAKDAAAKFMTQANDILKK